MISDVSIYKRNIILPLAISFFTFQQISFLVDCYKKKITPSSFTDYLLFVSFFPQLIAGPIVRYRQIVPQFTTLKTVKASASNFSQAIFIITIGLAKKVILADSLGLAANQVFDGLDQSVNSLEVLTATFCFSFQIYFDFSGYSDIAIGLGLFFGLKIPLNFKSPSKSQNISAYWQRWHITLTLFFRDYFYVPLSKNRKLKVTRYLHLTLTMLLIGLWHGANLTFIAWGAMQAIFLLTHQLFKRLVRRFRLVNFFDNIFFKCSFIMITFLSLCFSSLFFRSKDLNSAIEMTQTLFLFNLNPVDVSYHSVFKYLIASFIVVFLCPNTEELRKKVGQMSLKTDRDYMVPVSLAIILGLILLYYLPGSREEFIYFQF